MQLGVVGRPAIAVLVGSAGSRVGHDITNLRVWVIGIRATSKDIQDAANTLVVVIRGVDVSVAINSHRNRVIHEDLLAGGRSVVSTRIFGGQATSHVVLAGDNRD